MLRSFQFISAIASILLPASVLHGADKVYRPPHGHPELCIKKISVPQDKSKPIRIRFILSADGDGPVAISREQFSLHINPQDTTESLSYDLDFPKDAPQIFTAKPGSPVEITAISSFQQASKERRGWGTIKPGKYKAQVFINSDKTQKFDDQWLGQTYSDKHDLRID